jgi:HSP20 family protein
MPHFDPDSMNDIAAIQRQVMDLVKNIMLSHGSGIFADKHCTYTPAIDLFETDQEFICLVELSGVKKEGIKVYVEGNLLFISGEKRMTGKTDVEYICVERVFGQFARRIIIPKPFNRFKSKSSLSNGLLKIILPKITSDRRSEGINLEVIEE